MPKIATATHPLLRPFFNRRQRCVREEQARARLHKLGQLFVHSRAARAPDQLRIWVRGFRVSAEEETAGFKGHFVLFALEETAKGWRISAKKVAVPLEQHPERHRAESTLPNWGYPVLRSAKKKRVFATETEAKIHLQQLLEVFPKACRQQADGLVVSVYGRHAEYGAVMEKIILRITHDPALNGWLLDWIADPASPAQRLRQREESGVAGAFSQRVLAGKKAKRLLPGAAAQKERRAAAVQSALRQPPASTP